MARDGGGFLGAGAGNGATGIGAFLPVLGIFCAPARLRGSTRTTGAQISAPERLKTAILVHIVRILRNTEPQLHQATKAPTDTHRFAPTALASDTRRFKAVAAPKNQPRGLPVIVSAKNNENKGGYGRGIGSGACAARHRHPPTFAPYAQHHWGPFDTPGACLRPRKPTQQSRSAAQ